MAYLLKTTRQFYSEYEREKTPLSITRLEFLADFFKVSTDYLLGRTKISKPYPKSEEDFRKWIINNT